MNDRRKYAPWSKLYARSRRKVNPVVGARDYCIGPAARLEATRPSCATSARNEGTLDDVVARLAHVGRDLESARIQHRGQVRQHGGTPANHDPILGRIQGRHVNVFEKLAGLYQCGNAALIAKALARHAREVNQLFAHQIAEIFVVRQLPLDVVAIGQFAAVAYAVNQNDFLEALINLRILDEAHEG